MRFDDGVNLVGENCDSCTSRGERECSVFCVSVLSFGGRLKLAVDCSGSAGWRSRRTTPFLVVGRNVSLRLDCQRVFT